MSIGEKAEIVRRLVAAGNAGDILLLLTGESPYTDPAITEPVEFTREQAKLWGAAQAHLKFVSHFGLQVSEGELGGRIYSAHPTEFESWLSTGCIGLNDKELSNYVGAQQSGAA